jgi:hypothetical protein
MNLISNNYYYSDDSDVSDNSYDSEIRYIGGKCDIGEKGLKGDKGDIGEQGLKGDKGDIGEQGIKGDKGDIGEQGIKGDKGDIGEQGIKGDKGDIGEQGIKGDKGDIGEQGLKGDIGEQGLKGDTGVINISNFYALMPNDNSATIAGGNSVEFPNIGPTNNSNIFKLSSSTFNLPSKAIYEITFQISIAEAGQLVVVLDGIELLYTVVGRATGTSQIVGNFLISTNKTNSILSINNPIGSSTALTATPVAGGNNPVSAHIIIKEYI